MDMFGHTLPLSFWIKYATFNCSLLKRKSL
jgi:hypothetical protein